MSLQSAGGGDYSTLVINTLINRTQNIIYADSTPTTTFQGSVSIPSLRITDSVTNSPNPLSFVGDVNINGVLGNDKNLKGLIVGNRDFTKCDANGDGLPGTDPNANQVTNTIWGPSTFHTAVTIDKRQNPADAFNVFGLGLEVKNTSATPYPSIFGAPQAALTAFNVGHDGTNAGAEFNQTFFYYGPGHYRNKVSMDSSDNIFATTPALTITMPTRSLISSLSVMTGNYITTSGNVGTVQRINAFKDQFGVGTPVPGMTLTISAEPAELNVTNAIIISVIPKAGSTTNEFDLTYEFNAGGTYTSTKINYVYIGPGVYGSGSTGTVVFPKGPKPLVGQKISVLAQPTSLNITDGTILTVTEGPNTSSLTYALSAPLSTPVTAVAITSVILKPGTVGSNSNYGGQGNLGIHTLTPKASLDVTGDVIFREVTTNNPMVQITTIPHPGASPECTMTIQNPFDPIQPSVFVEYDLANQLIKYRNSVNDTVMYQVDASTGYQTYYNPNGSKVIDIACLSAPSRFTFYQTNGLDYLFKVDQETNTVSIASTATFTFPMDTITTKHLQVNDSSNIPFLIADNGITTFYKSDGTVVAKFDMINTRFAFGQNAVPQMGTLGDFIVSNIQTNIANLQVSSPSTMSTASDAVNLVVGQPGSYNVFRTDVYNKRVAINVSNPLYELDVRGEAFRSTPYTMGLMSHTTAQSIPNTTTTAILFTTRDALMDYGPGIIRTTGTGVVGDPFINSGLGLTLDPTTGQFKYSVMGGLSSKYFNINCQVGFASNATGFRQIGITIYATDGVTVKRTYGSQTVNPVSGSPVWMRCTQSVLINNNESFAVTVYQSSGAALNTYGTATQPVAIQIRHI